VEEVEDNILDIEDNVLELEGELVDTARVTVETMIIVEEEPSVAAMLDGDVELEHYQSLHT
jgi:hypothetical protein